MEFLPAPQEVGPKVITYFLMQPAPKTLNSGVVYALEGHKRWTFMQIQRGGKILTTKGQSRMFLQWLVHTTQHTKVQSEMIASTLSQSLYPLSVVLESL